MATDGPSPHSAFCLWAAAAGYVFGIGWFAGNVWLGVGLAAAGGLIGFKLFKKWKREEKRKRKGLGKRQK